ncbi:hypothetical protein [Micromonospora zingiberis]|uniref:hypothetical protein n=1 Tax=Micromonospora zingiberis TaxID=2053011 RepID=UPI0013F45629|nr:hypothetical protein [Micromonospora zingiberis]
MELVAPFAEWGGQVVARRARGTAEPWPAPTGQLNVRPARAPTFCPRQICRR